MVWNRDPDPVPESPPAPRRPDETLELLTFASGGERFAIESCWVRAVGRSPEPGAVPGREAAAVGVALFEGGVAPVFDLAALLAGGRSQRPPRRSSRRMLAVGRREPELGLLCDAEPVWRRERDLRALPWRLEDSDRELVRGVTGDGVIVIDGEALLTDARFRLAEPTVSAPGGRTA